MGKAPLEIFPCSPHCPLLPEYYAKQGATASLEISNRLSELTYLAAKSKYHLRIEFETTQIPPLSEVINKSLCLHPNYNGLGGLPGLCFLKKS